MKQTVFKIYIEQIIRTTKGADNYYLQHVFDAEFVLKHTRKIFKQMKYESYTVFRQTLLLRKSQ